MVGEEDKTQRFGGEMGLQPDVGELISKLMTEKAAQAQKIAELTQVVQRLKYEKEEYRTQIAELEVSNAEQRRVLKGKDTFFTIVAHDLRNAFNIMLNLPPVLINDWNRYTEEEKQKFMITLSKAAETTSTLLDNFLILARSQKGLIEYSPERLSLNGCLGNAHDSVSSEVKRKNVNIMLGKGLRENIEAYFDPNMIGAVVRNLLTNAIKFTEAEGQITIDCEDGGDYIEISVFNPGEGISDEGRANLFQIYKEKSKPGTAGERGTGLGLIICKELVEKNGGRIWVESEPGEGATFRFTLPKSEAVFKRDKGSVVIDS